ncbi:Altered inheritance of mitochondria protein 6 [Cladophialophora chaetospira]|uniref:Altered inheritance of mitochondria protein 6 n=1 Tax=Cladophialophora chaetospira TaxID=386627 RepID=A0AA38XPL0_9EURO|nr:Altered inheritance of mitochondria protein 6 [Cladophialophora chaetospira]
MKSQSLLIAAFVGFKANAASIPASAQAVGLDISTTLQNILANTQNSDGYTYPTDLTRGIVVKPIHSHNDYWRDVPFYSALSIGATSIEADVWLYNDTLYVGHEASALTPARTLDALYIQPILDTLRRQNPSSPFVTSPTKNGVYDTSSGSTLLLFIDVKTNGETTWPAVVKALQPLRSGGYLTSFNGSGITLGAVTVVGTGNTPLDQIQPLKQRDYFFDAGLDKLGSTQSNITAAVAPVASTDFGAQIGEINGTTFNSTQLATLRSQIAVAKSKGILARYWDTPGWPISTRNAVWETLLDEGVGLLSVDDLPAAAGFGAYYGSW